MSTFKLATTSDIHYKFLIRIMRVLNASGFVDEASEENYTTTPLTQAMTISTLGSTVGHTNDHDWRSTQFWQLHSMSDGIMEAVCTAA